MNHTWRVVFAVCLLAEPACQLSAGDHEADQLVDRAAARALLPPQSPTGPRPIWPMSTSNVTTQTPTVRWDRGLGPKNVTVRLCRDVALVLDCQGFDVEGTELTLPSPLASGRWFWQVSNVASTAESPIWWFWVFPRSSGVSSSWGETLDLNRDGFADIAVPETFQDTFEHAGQRVFTFLGGATGPTPSVIVQSPRVAVRNLQVTNAGDVNGDGFSDLAVVHRALGCCGIAAGAAWVFLGGPDGVQSEFSTEIIGNGGFGFKPAPLGDVNGDGYADLAIPERRAFGGMGSVHIYLGGPAGLSNVPAVSIADPAWSSTHVQPWGSLDVNADGFGDLSMRVPLADFGTRIFHGSATGIGSLAATVIPGVFDDGLLTSRQVSPGDVNGDGFGDLALGTDVFFGASAGLPGTPSQSLAYAAAAQSPTRPAGDIDGNGYADFIVLEEPVASPGGALIATHQVHFGGPSGLATMPVTGPRHASVAAIRLQPGDVDGDGHWDMALAHFPEPFVQDRLQMSLYYGSAAGLPADPSITIDVH